MPEQGPSAKNYFICISSLLQFKFVTKLMNIIDFIAVLPYYISLAFYREDVQDWIVDISLINDFQRSNVRV